MEHTGNSKAGRGVGYNVKLPHVIGAIVLLVIGYYIGVKKPGLLSKVTG